MLVLTLKKPTGLDDLPMQAKCSLYFIEYLRLALALCEEKQLPKKVRKQVQQFPISAVLAVYRQQAGRGTVGDALRKAGVFTQMPVGKTPLAELSCANVEADDAFSYSALVEKAYAILNANGVCVEWV